MVGMVERGGKVRTRVIPDVTANITPQADSQNRRTWLHHLTRPRSAARHP